MYLLVSSLDWSCWSLQVSFLFFISALMVSSTTSWGFILMYSFTIFKTGKLSFGDPYKIVHLQINDEHRFEEALQKAS